MVVFSSAVFIYSFSYVGEGKFSSDLLRFPAGCENEANKDR